MILFLKFRLLTISDEDEIEFLHNRLLSNTFKRTHCSSKTNSCSNKLHQNHVNLSPEKQFHPQEFFFSHRKTASLSALKLSNVGRTTLTLFFILSIASMMIVNLNDGVEMPIVNAPDIEGAISDRFHTVVQFLGTSYDTIRAPFDGKQHLLNQDEDAFVCPEGKNGLQTIGSCFFFYFDYTIHNVIEAVPSYGRHFVNIFSDLVSHFAPNHFDVKDGFNSFTLFIQKFINLQNPATPRP